MFIAFISHWSSSYHHLYFSYTCVFLLDGSNDADICMYVCLIAGWILKVNAKQDKEVEEEEEEEKIERKKQDR